MRVRDGDRDRKGEREREKERKREREKERRRDSPHLDLYTAAHTPTHTECVNVMCERE